ncbi:MAG: hypothetical protein ACPL1G_02730, partial [Thermodesulfovibrionales bacterium]
MTKAEVIVEQTGKKIADRRLMALLEKISLYHEVGQRLESKGFSRSVLNLLLEEGIRARSFFEEKGRVSDLQRKFRIRGF